MRCSVEVAPIRIAPYANSEQVTQALRGEPLRITGHHGSWTRVTTAYGYDGWVVGDSLEEGEGKLPPALPLAPLDVARRYIGAPYGWGGLTGRGIDCSGLVHIAYRLTGRIVPRDAWQQEEAGERVAESQASQGDLLTYGTGERADHVAFWLKDGWILHATQRDALGVVEEPEPPELLAIRRFTIRL